MRKCWKVNLSYRWNHTVKFQRRLLSAVCNKNRLPPSQCLYVSQNIHTGRFKRQMENVMDWAILNNTGWGHVEIAFPSDIDDIVLWTSREIFHSSEEKKKAVQWLWRFQLPFIVYKWTRMYGQNCSGRNDDCFFKN